LGGSDDDGRGDGIESSKKLEHPVASCLPRPAVSLERDLQIDYRDVDGLGAYDRDSIFSGLSMDRLDSQWSQKGRQLFGRRTLPPTAVCQQEVETLLGGNRVGWISRDHGQAVIRARFVPELKVV
jgi:hypothetical protein